PSPYRYRFTGPSSKIAPEDDLSVTSGFIRAMDANDASLPFWQNVTPALWRRAQKAKKSAQDLAYLRAQYDGCLSYEDTFWPDRTRAMDRLDLWQNTIVIVMADHGEELGEHGGYGHYLRPLHEEILHIPLLIYAPSSPKSMRGASVKTPAEIIDLMPTMLDLL